MTRISKALPERTLEEESSQLHLLESRLTRLPEEILRGIEPWVIARQINEALAKSIADTGIPEAAKRLTQLTEQINEVSGAFYKSTRELIEIQDKVADHTRVATDRMQAGLEKSSGAATKAAERLGQTFVFGYKWSVFALTSASLTVGFLLGSLTWAWASTPK
ncbi:MAG TPA: hypothetical protein VKU19_40175 [Bryobacteraceae bacterium]|nr:hypothetical protein [Bryobacteraceae bacterium]